MSCALQFAKGTQGTLSSSQIGGETTLTGNTEEIPILKLPHANSVRNLRAIAKINFNRQLTKLQAVITNAQQSAREATKPNTFRDRSPRNNNYMIMQHQPDQPNTNNRNQPQL